MKDLLKLAFFAILGFSFVAQSCKKDQNDIIITQKKSDIDGFVLDENGNKVKQALVTIGSQSVNTNDQGYFKFKQVSFSGHLYVKVEKSGYFLGSRTVFPELSSNHHVRIKLIKKSLSGLNSESFSASTGGKVIYQSITAPAFSKMELIFPANAIVDANGNSYDGTVRVSWQYIDPTAFDQRETMPGDLVGLNTQNEQVFFGSYGMAAISLTGSSGQSLNVKSGSEVDFKLLIPSSLQSSAPNTIPLWYFDENIGLWKEEGAATKTGGYYIGKVKHFSFWNCDAPFPLVSLRGRLVYNDGPVANTSVRIKFVSTGNYGYGRTNQDGVFEGKVPKNELLELEVTDECGVVIYTQAFGPLSDNTDLGNIVIPPSTSQILTLTGKVLDCNNQGLANAFVLVKSGSTDVALSSDASGNYTARIIMCNSNPVTVTAYNLSTFKQSNTVRVSNTGAVSVPDLTVCSDPITADEYILLQSSTGINTIYLTNLNLRLSGTNPGGNTTGATITSEDSLHYMSLSCAGFTLGQPTNIFYISGSTNDGHSYFAQGSAGTITQGNGAVTCSQVAPTIGEYYEGTFYYNGATQVYNTITTTGVNLTGSFRLKRKQ
ncbi:MAG: carboxypeptidase regulatory-like domain-containing protein [Saprospiraceae bacterium]|nr:carboxypeptidase regulatory-like domain-containing protein [Saprospiraceae bacterium]